MRRSKPGRQPTGAELATQLFRWRGEIGSLIAEGVHNWDVRTVSDRLELVLGSDLQYIRTNGTIVGASEILLEEHRIRHTIIVFGSTRIRDPAASQRKVDVLKAGSAADAGNMNLKRQLAIAETSLALGIIPILNHDSPAKKSGY